MPLFDRPAAIRSGVRALTESVAAFSYFTSAGDVDAMYQNYVQAVMWACSLDELFEDEPGYRRCRADEYGGQVITAMRWARDKGLHQLAALHEAVPCLERGPVLGPGYPNGRYPAWLSSKEVALRDPRLRSGEEAKRKRYDEVLGGRPLWSTLTAAAQFLFMQPWAPVRSDLDHILS